MTDHHTVDPAEIEELLARRAALITAIRADHPGLVETRLDPRRGRVVRRRLALEFRRGDAGGPPGDPPPEAREAMSLTQERSSQDGEIVDER